MKKPYNCEMCHDTGWYGDNGPGIKGNREYNPCECKSKPAEPIFENDVRWVWKWDDGSYHLKKPIKKLVKGRDWDGFAFVKHKTGKFIACYMSNPLPWYPGLETTKTGKWVRVKFLEVKS